MATLCQFNQKNYFKIFKNKNALDALCYQSKVFPKGFWYTAKTKPVKLLARQSKREAHLYLTG